MKLDRKGFTLIELLTVISISALIVLIIGYSIISIIDNVNNKQYKLSIASLEKAAENYTLKKESLWIDSEDDYYFQCVEVQKLINMGFFKNDLLKTKVSKNKKVERDDRILVLKDKNSKSITSSEYLFEDNSLCDAYYEDNVSNLVGEGEISFIVLNSDSNSINIDINYVLSNVDDSQLSSYLYVYELVGKSEAVAQNFDELQEVVNFSITESVTIRSLIKKGDILIAEKEEKFTIQDNDVDDVAPRLDIVPYVEYISVGANDKQIDIKAYDNESGLKVGTHTINYLFTTKEINSCDELVSDSESLSKDFNVISGNEFGENIIRIEVPNMQLTTPTNLSLYVCSKNLEDNAGNLFNSIIKDELNVYDLENITSTALFYLPSVLDCDGDICSLGSGINFFANGVNLSAGTEFYYLWNQPMNVFKMYSFDWPFIGAYVAFDDIENLFKEAGDSLYNEALNSTEVIFDDVTGTKYVFGYIPLSHGGKCLTSIPCN